jgi:phosphoglycolate phosphatase-like HAD superfamily hydrolase
MRIKTVILDFDGTVVESVGIKDWAFETLFERYPEHLDQIMEYHLCHNASVRYEKFQYITENILNQEYSKETERTLSRRFSALVFRRIVECSYVPGAEDFLDYFSARLPLYLASASPAEELEGILKARNLKRYFKRVYAIPWAKEDVIRDILITEKIPPDEAVFVGDAFEDYQAAQSAQVFFIGRRSNKSFRNADIPVYNDLSDIKTYLSEFIE